MDGSEQLRLPSPARSTYPMLEQREEGVVAVRVTDPCDWSGVHHSLGKFAADRSSDVVQVSAAISAVFIESNEVMANGTGGVGGTSTSTAHRSSSRGHSVAAWCSKRTSK